MQGPKKNKTNNDVSGIVLLAKQSGKTSFQSLSTIKRALGTTKVGHTGTLDSFADGLLVVLTGRLTRLVPHITNFDKDYLALIEFGKETDTLELTGQVIKEGPLPTEEQVRGVLPSFIGQIDQVPPAFSAIHIDGKRASDLARAGKASEIPARKITIYSLTLLDFYDKYALVEVRCSKGTYIRSLARDIAAACGSCAHLKALRRVSVGPFSLKDAAGSSCLKDFTISSLCAEEEKAPLSRDEEDELGNQIVSKIQPMTKAVAEFCGFIPVDLKSSSADSYFNGRPLQFSDFIWKTELPESIDLAVFSDGNFAGITEKRGRRLSYGFVVPQKKKMIHYSWDDVLSGRFSPEFCARGTALSIGSFDGPHIGHESLFDAVLEKSRKAKNSLVPGIVTFSSGLRRFKEGEAYSGDASTLAQKLQVIEQKGFAFCLVIDFSEQFSRIEGSEFLSILSEKCGMKFLAEGSDFRCGYKGATDIQAITALAGENGFDFAVIPPVLFENQRVRSTRIRSAVSNADFSSAKKMLGRPYQLDCSALSWEKIQEGECTGYEAKHDGVQVIPPEGTYSVSVIMSAAKAAAHSYECVRMSKATCEIKFGVLRLLGLIASVHTDIRAILF